MSKLSKFKGFLRFEEAAALLARLIGEPVTLDDLLTLHDNDWFPVFRPGGFELVPLAPIFSEEEHHAHVRDGRPFLAPLEGELTVCGGFHHPCAFVYTNEGRIWALQDAAGRYYGLRSIDSMELLRPYDESEPAMEDLLIESKDIYRLAQMANKDESTPEKPSLVREAHCLNFEREPLFNLAPSAEQTEGDGPGQEKYSEGNKPSLLLALSALLELARDGSARKRNASGIIAEITERYPEWRLSESTLQKLFAAANRAARDQGISPERGK